MDFDPHNKTLPRLVVFYGSLPLDQLCVIYTSWNKQACNCRWTDQPFRIYHLLSVNVLLYLHLLREITSNHQVSITTTMFILYFLSWFLSYVSETRIIRDSRVEPLRILLPGPESHSAVQIRLIKADQVAVTSTMMIAYVRIKWLYMWSRNFVVNVLLCLTCILWLVWTFQVSIFLASLLLMFGCLLDQHQQISVGYCS